jgi:hypothetical protein
MQNDSNAIRQKVGSGEFQHEGKLIQYELLSDGFTVYVKIEMPELKFEYRRNQNKNFRDDFSVNLKMKI